MTDDKEHSWHDFNKGEYTVLSRWFWGSVALAVALFLYFGFPRLAHADPRFEVSTKDARVVLYDDPCRLKEQITNLQYRATWHEGGKVFEGCWGPRPEVEAAVGYFEDKTIGVIPFGALRRVQGA